MIISKDNFLPESSFKELNLHMLSRFHPDRRYDNEIFTSGVNPLLDGCPIRMRSVSIDGNLMEPACHLGRMIPEVTEAMRSYLITDLNLKDPLPYHFWFQYHGLHHNTGPHHDGAVRDNPLDRSISTLLYTHATWEEDWGGELCTHGTELLTKPNRIVTYSRDEEHWVNSIKHGDPDYQRMFFGVSWSFYGFN